MSEKTVGEKWAEDIMSPGLDGARDAALRGFDVGLDSAFYRKRIAEACDRSARAAVSAAESRHAEAVRGLEAAIKGMEFQRDVMQQGKASAEQDVARLRAENERLDRELTDALLAALKARIPPTPPDALAAAEKCEALVRKLSVWCHTMDEKNDIVHGWMPLTLYRATIDSIRALDAQRAAEAGAGEREALVREALTVTHSEAAGMGIAFAGYLRTLYDAGFLTRPRGEGKS